MEKKGLKWAILYVFVLVASIVKGLLAGIVKRVVAVSSVTTSFVHNAIISVCTCTKLVYGGD